LAQKKRGRTGWRGGRLYQLRCKGGLGGGGDSGYIKKKTENHTDAWKKKII